MEKGSNFIFTSFLKILNAHGIGLSEFFVDSEEVLVPERDEFKFNHPKSFVKLP